MRGDGKSYEERIAELEAELQQPTIVKLHIDWSSRDDVPLEVHFGKSKKNGSCKITQANIAAIKRQAVERAIEQREATYREIERIREQAKAMKSVLDKKDDLTFAEFATIYAKHVMGDAIIPGFEMIPQRGSYRYSRYGRDEISRLYTVLEADRLVGWDRSKEPKPTRDHKGALQTKKLSDLEPEDCFLRIVEDQYGGKHRIPNDTTLHSWVRKVLGAAVTVGLLKENPASLKTPKEKTVVTARSAAAELQRVVKEGSDEPSRSVH